MSWPLVKISDFCLTGSGGTPSREVPEYYQGDIPWIKSGDLRENIVTSATEFISREAIQKSSAKIVSSGAILVAMYGATVGRMALLGIDAATNQAVCNITPDASRADTKYVYYALLSKVPEFLRSAIGGAQPNISQGLIRSTEILLPPLSEQNRIASILDKADAIRRKRQQAIKLADDFLRAVFLDMFGELVTSSGYASSQKYKLLELVDYIDYRGKTPEKSESGIPLITAKNVKSGYVDDEPREYIPEENYDAWMTRGFPRKNDILFTTEAPLGNVALLGEYQKVAIGQRLVALRSKGKVTHEYLLFLLLHPFVQDLIYARSSGSTVKGIRTKELYIIELPVPDMQKQKEFSAIYWKSKLLTSNQESAHQLEELNFSALSQKASSGQL